MLEVPFQANKSTKKMKKLLYISAVLMGLSTYVIAQDGYTSKDNYTGSWDDAATWIRSSTSLPATPGSNIGGGVSYIDVYGGVTKIGDLKIGSSVVLTVYDTLLIDGNFEVSGQSSLVVEPGGVLIVTGNFVASGGSVSSNGGDIIVQGDVTSSGSSDITSSGDFYVYGTVSSSGGSSFTGTYADEATLSSDNPELYDLVSGGTLPVEFLYVKASASFDNLIIKWATASETNNDFFTVERSKDGINFEEVASVNGAGNSEEVNTYEIEDNNAFSGKSYYRVKQTDFDGKFDYSNVVAVENTSAADVSFNVYPNPAVNQVNIDISRMGSNVKIEIMDINGGSVYAADFDGDFTSTAQIDVTSLPRGMYYVNVKASVQSFSKNLLIK